MLVLSFLCGKEVSSGLNRPSSREVSALTEA